VHIGSRESERASAAISARFIFDYFARVECSSVSSTGRSGRNTISIIRPFTHYPIPSLAFVTRVAVSPKRALLPAPPNFVIFRIVDRGNIIGIIHGLFLRFRNIQGNRLELWIPPASIVFHVDSWNDSSPSFSKQGDKKSVDSEETDGWFWGC